MRLPPRVIGSLVLLSAGVLVLVIAFGDPNAVSPLSVLLGAASTVVGFFGLFR